MLIFYTIMGQLCDDFTCPATTFTKKSVSSLIFVKNDRSFWKHLPSLMCSFYNWALQFSKPSNVAPKQPFGLLNNNHNKCGWPFILSWKRQSLSVLFSLPTDTAQRKLVQLKQERRLKQNQRRQWSFPPQLWSQQSDFYEGVPLLCESGPPNPSWRTFHERFDKWIGGAGNILKKALPGRVQT